MDIDERNDAGPSKVKTNGFHAEHQNEEEDWPLLYPVAIEGIPPATLSGSQDLISLFQLSNTYDTFVRPYLSASQQQAVATALAAEDIKGKGKAGIATPDAAVGGQAKDRARVMKKHYSHVIADVPGQNKLAKDRHIQDLLLNPDPPDQLKLLPFDSNALRDAFSLEVGTLPDFDTSIWKADAGEERKKKKKRKQDDGNANGGASAAPSPAATAPGMGKKRRMEQ